MDLDEILKNIEENEDKIEGSIISDAEEEYETLTSAEEELLLSQKRDGLYKCSFRAALVFGVISVLLMAAFKFNEDFFDANSRLGLLMESVNAQEEKLSYPKINIRAEFDDKQESKLIIPLNTIIDDNSISVREEFTRNKIVITLEGASENIKDGIKLTSDSSIMDAVGIYRQNLDVVIEVYCRGLYSYSLENSQNMLAVNFYDFKEGCNAAAVIYMPYEDRNRLALPEWQQSLAECAADNNIRLFMASNMQEPYTQQDIIDFAHKIDADVLIGFQAETDLELAQTQVEVICNTEYFISGFNSAQLAVIMADTFYSQTQLVPSGFIEADEQTPLISNAKLPAAMMSIKFSQKDTNSVEQAYKLNDSIVSLIKNTLSELVSSGYL